MGRPNRPRYRKDRDAWVTKINGRLHTLAKGARSRNEAIRALARLLASPGEPVKAQPVGTVGSLAADWAADMTTRVGRGELKAASRHSHLDRLRSFLEVHGDTPAASVDADTVLAWLDRRPDWSRSTRWCHVATIRAMFRWGVAKRRLTSDPLVGLTVPGPTRRRCEFRAADVRRMLEVLKPASVRSVVEFVYLTGCRPGEAVRITAADVDLGAKVVTLAEHKTARKTGRPRVIVLTPPAVKLVRAAMRAHPDGPIFRNAYGRPWAHNLVGKYVRDAGRRVGLAVCTYQLRHVFATDLLSKGVAVSLVSPLLGHAHPGVTLRAYDHTRERLAELHAAAKKR